MRSSDRDLTGDATPVRPADPPRSSRHAASDGWSRNTWSSRCEATAAASSPNPAPPGRTAAPNNDIRGLDFIRTAKAKGVGPQLLQRRHILRNALVPIVTMTGLQFGYLLGGAVVVEQVFSLPGIGRQVLIGIQQKEYAVVQSTVLIIAVAFVLVNLVTDAVYRLVDPRVRAA